MAEPKIKYDRQLRIWGEKGQAALEKASICLLNCGPTGSETLKNLVLGGIGSITVIDGSKVEVGDLGNNFMELNDAVKAKFIEEYPDALIETNPSFFSQFTLVIATQLGEDSMVKLDRICREANVKLIFARSYGLTGFVRISLKVCVLTLKLVIEMFSPSWHSGKHYVNLQKIYQAKAESDVLVIEQRVRNILKKIGRDPDSISKTSIRTFCKNARKLTICRYRLIEDEFNSPIQPELQKYLTDEDYSLAVGFYILLRAVDRFAANYNSFPGQFDGEMDEDISRLKTTAVGLLSDLGCNGLTLTEDLINEMCRFGAAELHAVAAFIGGIASQEVIKLITKQFVPMCGTFIFNGIDHKSQLLSL
ncbi:hypothetical protein L1049_024716 [Liquidambar formosana]|uniref:THIF-type NAD/FAD binding fold domain-containing protein n=1 Tax=Liquidambar formosana TaxID=63359 RepID=A0AAP0RYL8_LIQFO